MREGWLWLRRRVYEVGANHGHPGHGFELAFDRLGHDEGLAHDLNSWVRLRLVCEVADDHLRAGWSPKEDHFTRYHQIGRGAHFIDVRENPSSPSFLLAL